ncbi:DEAD/DEAH box helicase [Acidianus sp. RZ1]|uniref:DEAD/DEAH box helicase n=1 Tax=Acidianus sp. RZ1 TaxID=1540082 RepID=UPI00149322E4|nr:DEAD/DEAH box helicase [Acidianus sp. RZ1]NON63552.1 DEAD/DEAH box helicase [Acidianus sp. RZ1]
MKEYQLEFLRTLKDLGYTELTPIQKIAIPKVLSGKDALIIAPTGYGKTEAATIPVFYQTFISKPSKISSLYITPLRALNRDIETRLTKVGDRLGIKVGTRHGDTTRKERRNIRDSPPDMLITTPESLQYLILNEKFRELFSNLNWIIVDEIQEMIDEKRGYELSVVLERIKNLAKKKIQLIGISATIGDIELAKMYLNRTGDVEVARIDGRKEMEISLSIPQINSINLQKTLDIGLDPGVLARLEYINEIISKYKPVLIFTNTRETAEFLASELRTMYKVNIATHHGSLSREIRVQIEKQFKEGKLDAIVATSSLELGIDIGKISLVIQYMSPRQAIRLIQRIGRSGHTVGRKSNGIILPGNYIYDILECKAISELIEEGYLEKSEYESNPLDVLAHEIVGMVLEGYSNLDEIKEIISRSIFFSEISSDEIDQVISLLEAERIIKVRENKILPGYRSWKYYYNVNMIPDSVRSYDVINVANDTKIGRLDEEFVTLIDEESVFILGGKLWKVISIDNDKIFVSSTELKNGTLPSWFGESIPVEKEISKRVFKYLHNALSSNMKEYNEVRNLLEEHIKRGYPEISNEIILVEIVNTNLIVIHSPFGTRGNNSLGAVLSLVLSSQKGIRTSYRNDPYNIVIASMLPITKEDIERAIQTILSLKSTKTEEILKDAIKESPQFKWKLLVEAERFGAIDPNADIAINSTILKAYTNTIIGEEAVKEMMIKNYDKYIFDELKKYSWKIVEVPSPSPLAREFLNRILIMEHDDTSAVLEVFKARLLSKDVRLICTVCGWTEVTRVKSCPEACPSCSSVFLTVTFSDDKDAVEIIRKNIKGQKLKRNEIKRLNELKTVSSLFSYYKKFAAIGISARGVGPGNLGRILRSLTQGEDKFYEAILEEEKKFLRTRKYWEH